MNAFSDKDDAGEPDRDGRTSTAANRTIKMVDGRLDSGDLFVATREIIIGHGGETYRLRLTAHNKLILTK
jgi:hemin uptake protein HemP